MSKPAQRAHITHAHGRHDGKVDDLFFKEKLRFNREIPTRSKTTPQPPMEFYKKKIRTGSFRLNALIFFFKKVT